jgi:hypothetical protein
LRESAIQGAIVDFLRAVLPKTYRCMAIPNGSRRTANGRAANAVPGLTPGVLDLMLVSAGRLWFIEVKGPKGTLTDEQEEFTSWCAATGTPYCVARSVDDVRFALNHWNIPTREAL